MGMELFGRPNILHGIVLALALLLALSACKGDRGDDGAVLGLFTWSGDVLSIDMSNFGVSSTGNHPASGVFQQLTTSTGVVTWSSDWQGSEVNYAASLEEHPSRGEEGETGLLPNFLVEVPPLTAKDGEDGVDRSLRFDFEQDKLRIYIIGTAMTASPVSSQ
jgi:hypothetical protein